MKLVKPATIVTLVIFIIITSIWSAECPDQAEQSTEPDNNDVQAAIAEQEPNAGDVLPKTDSLSLIQSALKSAQKTGSITFTGTERSTLAGLRGVCLKVVLSSPAPVFHLTQQEIQRDIEMRLRSYGVNVLPENTYQTSHDVALLQIKVDWRSIETLRVIYAVSKADVLQIVVLPRNGKLLCTYAITWNAVSGTVVRLENLDDVYDNVHDVIDDFIKDFLAANQKEQIVGEELKPLDEQ